MSLLCAIIVGLFDKRAERILMRKKRSSGAHVWLHCVLHTHGEGLHEYVRIQSKIFVCCMLDGQFTDGLVTTSGMT